MLKLEMNSFCMQKGGETEGDCQDSTYPEPGNSAERVFAVADGTTQSFYSQCWARTLTRYFSEHPDGAFEDWEAWLSEPRAAWRKGLVERMKDAPGDLYLRNGFNERQPAAATFVGLQLLEPGTDEVVRWRALILGDSCLFHLRGGGEVICYFKKSPGDFTFCTESAQSYPTKSPNWPTPVSSSNGGTAARRGDAFLLATDAFSKWLLGRQESGLPVWGAIAKPESQAELTALVLAARRDVCCALDNDDVAIVAVRLGPLDLAFAGQRYTPSQPAPQPVRLETTDSTVPHQPLVGSKRQEPKPPVGLGPKSQAPAAKPAAETLPKLPSAELRPPVTQARSHPVQRNEPRPTLGHKSLLAMALALTLSFVGNLLLYTLVQRSDRKIQMLSEENEHLANSQQLRAKDAELRTLHRFVDKLSASAPALSIRLDQLDDRSKALRDLLSQVSSTGSQLSTDLDQFGLQLKKLRELVGDFQTSAGNSAWTPQTKIPTNPDADGIGATGPNNP
jgi:hypothetical protein